LRSGVEAAAERWGRATDCAIEVSDAGVPVHVVASITRPDGSQAPGWTSDERDVIEINVRVGPAQRGRVEMHELGHALGGNHTDSDGVLSGAKERRDVIDWDALMSVCQALPCGVLRPEEM
jgi:hypothetical protein